MASDYKPSPGEFDPESAALQKRIEEMTDWKPIEPGQCPLCGVKRVQEQNAF